MALVETAAGGGQSAFVAKRDEKVDALWVKEELAGDEVTADQMWANYEYFMRAVLPTAKEAGVKLALHPDDPPMPSLGGVARLFKDVDGLQARGAIALDLPGATPGASTSASAAARRCPAARPTWRR
jgi:mannonate dehydratase